MDVCQHLVSRTAPQLSPSRTIKLIGLTLALGYLIVLGGTYRDGYFLTDAQHRPIANDFVNVWAAGRLTLDGDAASAYDWPTHKAAEVRAVGHDFADYYGWHYPPTFLFVAAALAMLPYLVAAGVWLLATLAAYAATLGGMLGGRTGIFFALGFPAALWNVTAGQNGFLTAALIGGTLGLLERRPALAGACLGLLTYKPQFGLLFPLVLIADRRWLTIAVAALVTIGLGALSWLAFGSASWQAFVHWLPITSTSYSAKAPPTLAGCKACSGWCARMAAAKRSPGPFRRRQVLGSLSGSSGCGEAALRSTSRPLRSLPARCSRHLIFICTTW
jgi:hypothetical protein